MITQELLDTLASEFYGNSVIRWIIAGCVFIFGTAILAAIKIWIVKRLGEKAKRTTNTIDDIAVELVKKTQLYFYVALALKSATSFLILPPKYVIVITTITLIAILIQLAVWINTLIDQLVNHYTKRHVADDSQSVSAIKTLSLAIKAFMILVLALVALQQSGFKVETLLAGLGIGGIAIALAVQNILGDLFAAFSIIVDKPFVVGDSIQVDSLQGTVEKIGLKTTRVRANSGEQIIFANGDLLKSRIRNYRRMYQRRVAFTLNLSSNTSAEIMESVPLLMKSIVEAQEQVRFGRSHFAAIGEDGYQIETVYFVTTPNYDSYLDIQQAINLGILKAFKGTDIQLSAPSPPVVINTQGTNSDTIVS